MGEAPRGPADSANDERADRLDSVELETLLRARASRPARALAVVALALLAAILAGVLAFANGGGQRLRAWVTPPTPTPAITYAVAILSNVSGGTLTVNGRRAAGPAPAVAHLRRGRNTITLDAPPFRAHTCAFAWPLSGSDPGDEAASGGCSFDFTPTPISIGGVAATDGALLLQITGADLPDDLRAGAEAAIWQALADVQASTRVPVGDYFATGLDARGAIQSRRATEPLVATLTVGRPEDAPPPAAGAIRSIPCGNLSCGGPPISGGAQSGTSGLAWGIGEGVMLGWRFTNGAGAAVGALPPISAAQLYATLAYDAAAGWRLVDTPAGPFPSPFPGPIAAQLSQDTCQGGMDILVQLMRDKGIDVGMGTADAGLEGCDIRLGNSSNDDRGRFVWRFGVLLAADDPAHTLFPQLPIAPADEVAAVGHAP